MTNREINETVVDGKHYPEYEDGYTSIDAFFNCDRTIRLYAMISLDSIRTGNRYATCTRTKPEVPRSEYAVYELRVNFPETTDIGESEAGNTIIAVDLYDCTPCPDHVTAWVGMAWHTERHQMHIAYNGVFGDVIKGAHVEWWEEI